MGVASGYVRVGDRQIPKALVTGGGGFIGSRLCAELLANGYGVVVFDRRKPGLEEVEFVDGDIRESSILETAAQSCDIVFHLAGLLGTSYLNDLPIHDSVDVNIGGAINVYEAARKGDALVINVGLVPDWLNAYMITKKTATRFGRMYYELFETQIATLEVTHVYGPGQPVAPYYKAIPTFIDRALRNEPFDVYGTGKRLMDCVYVDDVARALRLAAETPAIAGQVIGVSCGEGISVLSLAEKIRELVGSTSEIRFKPMRSGEPAEISTDEGASRGPHARTLLNWAPETSLEEGLEKTIASFRLRQ